MSIGNRLRTRRKMFGYTLKVIAEHVVQRLGLVGARRGDAGGVLGEHDETGQLRHALALELYRRPVHEGRILASMIADPALFRPEEMDAWVAEFRSWDLCDQCCINLFRYTSYAYGKVREYAASDEEFTRRAGFALLATLAVGDKRASDDDFRAFLPLIERGAEDSRVRIGKAVNWALRQIGKRSRGLYPDALALARRLAAKEGAAARRIGRDAVRELTLERIIARIK